MFFSRKSIFLCFHFVLDIFTQPKKAKPVKKTTAQAKKTSVLSIFDENAPSIFDDPLNALGGDQDCMHDAKVCTRTWKWLTEIKENTEKGFQPTNNYCFS